MNSKQEEILRIAQEECAEVTQVISKIFRFGIDESYNGKTNRQRLEAELGDLVCMIDLLIETGIVDRENVGIEAKDKRERLTKWSTIFS
jgi:NTP pyrophosphatase (non-canonical NTP hydrolase)